MTATASEIQGFLAKLPPDHVGDFASLPDLPERLSEVWLRVHEAWPTFETKPTAFFPYLAERIQLIEGGSQAPALLDDVDAPGLYLACACIQKEQMALQSFQQLLNHIKVRINPE